MLRGVLVLVAFGVWKELWTALGLRALMQSARFRDEKSDPKRTLDKGSIICLSLRYIFIHIYIYTYIHIHIHIHIRIHIHIHIHVHVHVHVHVHIHIHINIYIYIHIYIYTYIHLKYCLGKYFSCKNNYDIYIYIYVYIYIYIYSPCLKSLKAPRTPKNRSQPS